MADKIRNTANEAMGGTKEKIGSKIGNPNMAASGAAQKSQAQANQRAKEAERHAHGMGHNVEGQTQKTTGAMTGDRSLEARGYANDALGDAQRKI
ncbi:hypothetical protein BGZ51_007294 [Haplosporangium sp. Z 767]|nr:hypothetical protein BGZ50_007389 [Haplosporangium sp. Z 11]KAF9179014.1 hypothetical protein BGZ51_007294 [Haplosporangium sp. Z 767]